MYCSEVGLDDAGVFSPVVCLSPDSSQRIGSMELILGKDPVELVLHLLQGERVISSNSYSVDETARRYWVRLCRDR